jgi:hypothetical protein
MGSCFMSEACGGGYPLSNLAAWGCRGTPRVRCHGIGHVPDGLHMIYFTPSAEDRFYSAAYDVRDSCASLHWTSVEVATLVAWFTTLSLRGCSRSRPHVPKAGTRETVALGNVSFALRGLVVW